MAITNAQQYQQLVNKPADGKRPGYRGPGGYQGGGGSSSGGSKGGQGPAGGASSGGNYGGNTGGGNGGGYNDRERYQNRQEEQRREKQRIEAEQAKKDKIAKQAEKDKQAKQLADFKRIEAEQAKKDRIAKQAEKDKQAKQLADFKKQKEKELVEFQKKEQEKKDRIAKEAKIAFDLAEKKRIAKEAEDKKAKELSSLGIKNAFKGFFSNLPSVQIARKLASMNKNPNRQIYMDSLKKNDPVAYAEMVENLRGLSGQTVPPSMGFKTPDLVFGPPGDADLEFGDLSTVDELGGKFGFGEGYDNYMDKRMSGETDAYGNVNPDFGKGDGDNYVPPIISQQPITPVTPVPVVGSTTSSDPFTLAPRFMGSIFDFSGGRTLAADGGMMMKKEYRDLLEEDEMEDPTGGIMDLESGRQMYFLGKLVKKATRAVKKVAKSPIGKAALLYGLGSLGAGALGKYNAGTGSGFFSGLKGKLFGQAASKAAGPMKYLQGTPFTKGLFGKLGLTTGGGSMMPTLKGGLSLGLGIPFALDALGVGKEEEDEVDLDSYYASQGLDIDAIRNSPYRYLAPRSVGTKMAADGGLMRTGYQEGGDAEPVAKKTMPLIDMDGMEKDYREDGGFVPIGRMERADDVPARLSKNEFVFTADAVRNAGEGDIDKGAEVMYNMMKNLESGGEVSEESQGLDGAREMFQTSKRLEEVL